MQDTVRTPSRRRRQRGTLPVAAVLAGALATTVAAEPTPLGRRGQVSAACVATADRFAEVFSRAASRMQVPADPTTPKGRVVAFGVLAAVMEDLPEEGLRRRCFAEVLRAYRVPDPLTLDEVRAMLAVAR